MQKCEQWPMSVLTKPSGEEGRKLVCHPKQLIARKYLRRDESGKLLVTDPDKIKIPDKSLPLTLFTEAKLQGHRHIYSCDKDGQYHLHSRRLGVNCTFPDLIQDGRFPVAFDELIAFPSLPRETAVDGELVWPGHPDSEVPTAIKDHPHELRFKAFAIPIYKGNLQLEIGYKPGRRLLHEALPSQCIARSGDKWNISSRESLTTLIEHLLYIAEKEGEEGVVLKQKHCQGWWKLKGIREADVFVTGFVISKSETYEGQVTSLRIGVFDKDGVVKDMGKVSGFDDDEKAEMTDNYIFDSKENDFIGRVLRVQYQEIAGKGKLKHAFFDCWRDDKAVSDCTTEQFGEVEDD